MGWKSKLKRGKPSAFTRYWAVLCCYECIPSVGHSFRIHVLKDLLCQWFLDFGVTWNRFYTRHGHKLRFLLSGKAQFVTAGII